MIQDLYSARYDVFYIWVSRKNKTIHLDDMKLSRNLWLLYVNHVSINITWKWHIALKMIQKVILFVSKQVRDYADNALYQTNVFGSGIVYDETWVLESMDGYQISYSSCIGYVVIFVPHQHYRISYSGCWGWLC